MYKIFVAEDDDVISEKITSHLRTWGYEAVCVQDFSRVLAEFASYSPHLVLLDISLPFFDGYHWCSEIRKISKTPIIFISSASDNMNVIMAMNMGGDDFIAKPFDLNVLTSKVQALLRRIHEFGAQTELTEHNGAILNMSSLTLTCSGMSAELTKNENKILMTLLENKGKTVSRDTLMIALWQTDNYVDENTLSVNIARLRQKLDKLGLNGFIETKKGLGYIVN